MANNLEQLIDSLELMKKVAPNSEDYWMGRDLQSALGYTNWANFESVIRKGIQACKGTMVNPQYHFVESSKMIEAGKGAMVKRADWLLTRYACYLIAMNGDPTKPKIATAQSYFAVQTRRQEIADAAVEVDLDAERIQLRERVRINNRTLAGVAKDSGVKRFGLFNDAGYRGLYDMGIAELKRLKGIADKDSVLDVAGREELAAHDFRITQTEAKLKKEGIKGEWQASNAHLQVGREVRRAIKRVQGTMPEKLPKEPHIKTLISSRKSAEKKLKSAKPKKLQ
jgi:DNA-damage-inducible protein D